MLIKPCSKCKIEKPLSEFSKSKRHLDGRVNKCKSCRNSEVQKSRDSKKEERLLEYDQTKFTTLKTCTKCKNEKKLNDFYFENNKNLSSSRCKECFKKGVNKYRIENRDEINKKKRIRGKKYWRETITEEQRERRREHTRDWRSRNSEHIKKYNSKYKKENKALCKQIAVERRIMLENSQPNWVNRERLIAVYDKVPEGQHVDHIIPIKHKNVCGLHVPWNLQYLEPKLNHSKNNKFDGTIENESWRQEVRFD